MDNSDVIRAEMNNYSLVRTPKTPRIFFNGTNGIFEITGRSIPENSIDFYKPVLEWLDKYIKQPSAETILNINLEYFNTSSSKCLVEILKVLEKVSKSNKVEVNWHYEEDDEDMMESGEDFRKIVNIPINLVVV